MQIIQIAIEKITQYKNNAKEHPAEQIEQIKNSIKEFGMNDPIAVDENNMVIEGHGRLMALAELDYKEVPCIVLSHLSLNEKKAYILAHNKLTLNSGFDEEILLEEMEELYKSSFDLELTGFSLEEIEAFDFSIEDVFERDEEQEFIPQVTKEQVVIKKGDLIELGKHRVLCGDSTSEKDLKKLMKNSKADLVFTDPPYGMKKSDIENDNLNNNDLLEFNKKWIPLSFLNLKSNGSWYCWGIDQPLMDIYVQILQPMILENKLTFRNLLTWDKGNGQGMNSAGRRMYAIADEKCLFVMCGTQGFNNNADNFNEEYEPIRLFMKEQFKKIGTLDKSAEVLGVSGRMIGHYVSRSQWEFIPKDKYDKMTEYCKANDIEAFGNHKDISYQYLNKEENYQKMKNKFYEKRAYFNNTHDNFNNVWNFKRHLRTGEEGGHSTPKPIPLCERAILSSSREKEIVLDQFLGSGSTLIACENQNRKCYGMELDENYVKVIIERWCGYTSIDTIKINGKEVSWEDYKNA